MSRYFAGRFDEKGNLLEFHDIFWRKFPKDHAYHSYGWYRLFWGEEELAWLTRGRSVVGWDVIIKANSKRQEDSQQTVFDRSQLGKGFVNRWYATEYVLRSVGIWPIRD